jgi:hypothetical protein
MNSTLGRVLTINLRHVSNSHSVWIQRDDVLTAIRLLRLLTDAHAQTAFRDSLALNRTRSFSGMLKRTLKFCPRTHISTRRVWFHDQNLVSAKRKWFFLIHIQIFMILFPFIPSDVTFYSPMRIYSRLSIIRAWFNRFAAQPRQCIFKEKNLFSVNITFV